MSWLGDHPLPPLTHIDSEKIVKNHELASKLMNVQYQQPQPLKQSTFELQIDSSYITDKIIFNDHGVIKFAMDKNEHIRNMFNMIDDLALTYMDPVADTRNDKVNAESAVIFVRCRCHVQGINCSTRYGQIILCFLYRIYIYYIYFMYM